VASISNSSDYRLKRQIAAHTSWANTPDRTARTAPARAAAEMRFERMVDPEGILPPEARSRMAESQRKAYFKQLALKSAQVRKTRAVAGSRPS
jgi:hypothetical protein